MMDRASAIRDKAAEMGDLQQDPSMEEILASIKRVIAEDSRGDAAAAARARRATAPEAATPVEEDVLELDDPVTEESGLMSTDAAAASRERLAALSALRQRNEAPVDAGALEAVVRDMLRPMLKAWLDERLPEIVEQLVTREIARITGRSL
jgi:cell pole-organizing protein PopZ